MTTQTITCPPHPATIAALEQEADRLRGEARRLNHLANTTGDAYYRQLSDRRYTQAAEHFSQADAMRKWLAGN